MDIDISDILASVSRPSTTHHRSSHGGPPTPYLPDTSTFTDHQLLTRAWTSERCTPELLPYPASLMNRMLERVAAQIERIEELASGGADTSGSREKEREGANVNLVLSILQTDLSRTQFLVRSLLRVRLGKLGRWAGYYSHLLSQLQDEEGGADTSEAGQGLRAKGLLSTPEAQFLQKQQLLLKGFYEGSFLSSFPGKLKRLDEGGTGEGGMLEGPGGEGVVVVRCLVEEGWGNEDQMGQEDVKNELRMRRGEVWVVRWGDVRGGVVKGELEVL